MNNEWILNFSLDCDIKETVENLVKQSEIYTDVISTTGKNSEQYFLDTYQSNVQLKEFLEKLKSKLVEFDLLKINRRIEILGCWTIYGYKGTFHKLHRHNNDFESVDMSLVYYMDVPEYDKYNPGTFYAIVNNEPYEYQPNKNDVLLFPVSVLHGTYPQGEGLRQSLNMDIRIYSDG